MRLKYVFTSLLLMFLLTACGGESNNEVDGESNDEESNNEVVGESNDGESNNEALSDGELSGEITVASWNLAADSLTDTAELFMEKYPETTVTVEYVDSDYDSITPPLTAGQGAPDVIQIQQRDFPNFMNVFEGQFVDISDRLGDKESEFADVAMNLVKNDNGTFALPWDIGPVGVYYRIDMFEEAGIDPESLTTWDKYIEAGKKLQSELDGVNMTAHSLTNDDIAETYRMLMNQQSGEYYDEEGNLDFVSEANIQALDMFDQMVQADLFLQTPTWDDRIRAFSNDQIATILFPVWYAGTIKTQAPDQEGQWGLMPMPAFEEGGPNQSHSGGSVLAISSQTENEELAWKFIEFTLMTNEGQDIQMDYGLFPSWQPYYETDNFKKEDEYFGLSLSEFFGDLSTDIPTIDYGAHFLDVNSAMVEAIGDVVMDGKDIEEALKDAEETAARDTGLEIAE